MKSFTSLITAGMMLTAITAPAFAQAEEYPYCGTSVPGLWWWKKGNPLQIDNFLAYSGLRSGEYIGAIDYDVGAGVLYGAGNHGGIYQIDTETGQASFMGSVGFDIEFPCGNDLKWWKFCPGCPPPPPPVWDFVIQQDLIMEVTLSAAGGVSVQFKPIPQFPASSSHAGVVPRITGLAALPSAGPQPSPWDLYAYEANTCGLYKVDELANQLLEDSVPLQPGCWPPDGGGWGLDAVAGPHPWPWFSFTLPIDTPMGPSAMFAVADSDIAGGQLQQLGLIGGGGIEILDSTAVVSARACPADLNGDGQVDFSDYLEFLNLYDALDPRVDFNGDGQVDFADYLEFLNFYDAGC